MDFSEPDHITMLREGIRRMLDKHATREQMAQWDAEDRVPRALIDPIREMGVALTTPEETVGLTSVR